MKPKEGKKCPQATEEVARSQYCGWTPRAVNAGCEQLEDCELVWEGQGVSALITKYFVIINTNKSNIVHEDLCHSIL